jgi:hypothetical protein
VLNIFKSTEKDCLKFCTLLVKFEVPGNKLHLPHYNGKREIYENYFEDITHFVGCFRFLLAVIIQNSVGTGPKKQMEQQWMGVSIFI